MKRNTLDHMTVASTVAEPQSSIVAATNEPMEIRVWLVVWGALLALGAGLYVFLYKVLLNARLSFDWAWPLALGLSIVGFVQIVKWVLPALTGDATAQREIDSQGKTYRQKSNNETSIWRQQLGNEAASGKHRHDEEMLRIELQAQYEKLSGEVSDIRRGLVQMSSQAQRQFAAPSLDADHRMAHDWALALYADGKPDPGKVHPGGQLRTKAPWNAGIEGWTSEATEVLTEGTKKFFPVLIPAGNSPGYKLNLDRYPTAQEVIHAFGGIVAEGWAG